MLSNNINDRLTPSVQKVLGHIPAHSYMHQNSLGCNLSYLNSSISRTRNVTSCDVEAFQNMLFRKRDLPLCSWEKWVDQLSHLLLWMLHCIFLQPCFLWTGILECPTQDIFSNLCFECLPYTAEEQYFLERFPASYSCCFLWWGVWVCIWVLVGFFFSFGRRRGGPFLALICILMLCKQRKRKNRSGISAQLMWLSTCLDLAPCGLRDTSLMITR